MQTTRRLLGLSAAGLAFAAVLACVQPASAAVCYWNVPTGNVDEISNWITDELYPPGDVPGTDPTDVAWISNDGTATVTATNLFGGTLTNLYVGGAPGAGPTPMGTGFVVQTGGAVATSGKLYIGYKDVGGGLSTYDLQGGSVSSGSSYAYVGEQGGDGKLIISGVEASPTTFSAARLYVGNSGDATTLSNGTLEMSGYSSVSAGNAVNIGSGTSAVGMVTMIGNASLNCPNSGGTSYLGNGVGADGQWTMAGNTTAEIGSVTNVAANFRIGYGGGTGLLSLTDNAAMTVYTSSNFYVGNGTDSNGTLSLSGSSTMDVHYTGTSATGIRVGGAGTARLEGETEDHIGTGTINLSGGTDTTPGAKLTFDYKLSFGAWEYSEGTLNVHDYAEFSGVAAYFGDNSSSTKPYPGTGNLLVDGHGKVTTGAIGFGNYASGVGDMKLWNYAAVNVGGACSFATSGGHATGEMNNDSTLTVGGTVTVGSGANAAGTLTMNANTVATVAGHLYVGSSGATGEVNLNTDATMNIAQNLRLGYQTTATGTINVNDTSDLFIGKLARIGYSTATGTINVNDTATLTMSGDWTYFGNAGAGTGTLNVNDSASVTFNGGEVLVGYDGLATGHLNLNGGTFTSTCVSLNIGAYNGTGYMDVHNNAQATIEDLQVGVNWQTATANLGIGYVTIDGADAVVTVVGSGTHINDDEIVDDVQLGTELQNTITIGSSGGVGTWTQNAGLTSCANTVILGEYDYFHWDAERTAGSGTLNLNGGTFACGGISTRSNAAVIPGTVGTINFDGGTLKALADNGAFITADATDATMTLNVLDGGVNIDTNGYNVGVNPGLVEDAVSTGGGLTKNGLGTLTLAGACTYTGATAVNAGGLAVDGSIISDVTVDSTASLMGDGSIDGDVDLNGTFVINYNSDYDTVDSLDILGALDLTGSTINFMDFGTGTLDGTSFVLATYASLTGVPTTTVGLPTGWVLDYAVGGNSIVMTNTATPLPGDADNNGSVNDADAAILASHWLQSGPTIGWSNGDFNNDDVVDDRDAAILAAHWVRGTEGANVPEPGTLALLLGGLLAVAAMRRIRR